MNIQNTITQLHESTLGNTEWSRDGQWKWVEAQKGFKDKEYVVSIGDEYTGSDVIKWQRPTDGTEKLSQIFLTE